MFISVTALPMLTAVLQEQRLETISQAMQTMSTSQQGYYPF
jgi:hypothetical protein